MVKKVEILSPAGGKDSLFSAFEAGADAVYFGVSEFNARKRAENIELSGLSEIVSEAYLRGIKLYLTLNTLVSSDEIPVVLDLIDSAMISGIRCFIIQDYGILNILEKFYPEAEIHVSTQSTCHLKGQIDFLSETSVSRINLARELSLPEVCNLTDFAHSKGIETEVFIHGSYCLSYSGQCYLSSYLEGLSGNRGLCAQLCRRLYRNENGKKYLLNLKDNSAFPLSRELIECGVDSLKIEGRIKGPEYVYTVVKTWKDIVEGAEKSESGGNYEKNLESVFNRGFTSGYLEGNISENMFSDSPSDSSYRLITEISSYSADRNNLETILPLFNNKDNNALNYENLPFSIIIKTRDRKGLLKFICMGKILKEVSECRYLFEIEGKLNGKIERGNLIFMRNKTPVSAETEKLPANPVFRKIPASVVLNCREGERLSMTLVYKEESHTAFSESDLEKGKTRTSSREDIENQVSRFGNTPLDPSEIIFKDFSDGLFIPSSVINKVRRKAVSLFLKTIDKGRKQKVLEYFDNIYLNNNINNKSAAIINSKEIVPETVLIADDPDLAEILMNKTDCKIFYDYKSLSDIPETGIIPIFNGIMPGEYAQECMDLIKSRRFKKIVINNTALIKAAEVSGTEWIAGDSLNIINHASADFFNRNSSFAGFVLSPEAGRREIKAVSEKSPVKIYLPFYTRAKLMTSRQCLLGYRCGKKRSDERCFAACCGISTITDVRGKKIIIEKRSESFTELYDEKYHFIHEAASDFRNTDLTFIIDLRIFPDIISQNGEDRKNVVAKKISLYENLKKYLQDPGIKNSQIEKIIKKSSQGNYQTGLL